MTDYNRQQPTTNTHVYTLYLMRWRLFMLVSTHHPLNMGQGCNGPTLE